MAIVARYELQRIGLEAVVPRCGMRLAQSVAEADALDLDRNDAAHPAIVLLDALALEPAFVAARDILARWPGCRIVLIADDCSSPSVLAGLRLGLAGYVARTISLAGLVNVLRLVALGEKVVPSVLCDELMHSNLTLERDRALAGASSNLKLSTRDIAILSGLVRGEPNKVISRKLHISEATVKVHVKSLLRRLGVANRTQAAIMARSRGYVDVAEAGSGLRDMDA